MTTYKGNPTYTRRRAAGLCAKCGKVKSERFCCSDCQKHTNERVRDLRKLRAQQGRCKDCNAELDVQGKVRCSKCCEIKARGSKRRYLRRALEENS